MMLPQMKDNLVKLDRAIRAAQTRGDDEAVKLLVAERTGLWLRVREIECSLVGCGG